MGLNSLLLTGGMITVCYGRVKEDQMIDKTFKIEKGVPIMEAIKNGGAPPKYPFRAMEIGDSIVGSKAITVAAREWFRGNGRQCVCRKQPDGSYRVWRTT
jgi:hypothetical protein